MSVKTDADEAMQYAYVYISKALLQINKVRVEKVPGHDDFNEKAQSVIRDTHTKLLEMRDDLEIFNKYFSGDE